LQVQNKLNSFNGGDLAYMVNFLMMVIATTKQVEIWTDCVQTLESLSEWCTLLKIFRQILNKMHSINNNVKLLTVKR
jgi:hypothetical protein